MENIDAVLKATIVYHHFAGVSCRLGCSLIMALSPSMHEDKPYFSANTFTKANDDLEIVHITGEGINPGKGINFKIKGIDIQGIAFKEGPRFLEFMKEMYGLQIKYKEDIFGFLFKNEKEQEILIEIPFPEVASVS